MAFRMEGLEKTERGIDSLRFENQTTALGKWNFIKSLAQLCAVLLIDRRIQRQNAYLIAMAMISTKSVAHLLNWKFCT